MLHRTHIKALTISVADEGIRPSIAGIVKTGENIYESTDTYRATKIVSKVNSKYPDTSTFFPTCFELFHPVDREELEKIMAKAVFIAKANGEKRTNPIALSAGEITYCDGSLESLNKKLFMGEYSPCFKINAGFVLEFLKSLPKEKTVSYPLSWYQESPLAPLAFRYEDCHATIHHIIMPLK